MISSGGGAKSDYWNQLKADITGVPVTIPENAEAALFGAAIIGAVASGQISDYKQAADLIKVVRKFYPHKNAVLQRKRQLFDDIYERLFR